MSVVICRFPIGSELLAFEPALVNKTEFTEGFGFNRPGALLCNPYFAPDFLEREPLKPADQDLNIALGEGL